MRLRQQDESTDVAHKWAEELRLELAQERALLAATHQQLAAIRTVLQSADGETLVDAALRVRALAETRLTDLAAEHRRVAELESGGHYHAMRCALDDNDRLESERDSALAALRAIVPAYRAVEMLLEMWAAPDKPHHRLRIAIDASRAALTPELLAVIEAACTDTSQTTTNHQPGDRMNTDKETWLVEQGLAGPLRVVTGRKAMIDMVSRITGHNIAKSPNPHNMEYRGGFWRGVSERPTAVRDEAFAHSAISPCWLARVTRVLGPDDTGY
jgi:hypothetical protein